MDGVINFNKPVGITSAKALYQVRRITRVRKSGHTGTLDPGAEGVLVLCLGRATKLVERVMNTPKVYHARARLDVTSSSYDSDRPLEAVPVAQIPDEQRVAAALAGFVGEIEQIPPAVSALKVGGIPAYKLARQGVVPSLAPRRVRIYQVCMHRYAWPELDFELCCGRGTYVRAVIRDLGARLGTGGCLTGLTRTAVGPFTLAEAWTIERMQTSSPADYILPLARVREMLDRAAAWPADRPVRE